MRIRCPSCSATYNVADALLDNPRTVRCAKCARDWTATAIPDHDLPEGMADTGLAEMPAEPGDDTPATRENPVSFHEAPAVEPVATSDPDHDETAAVNEPATAAAVLAASAPPAPAPALSAIERLAVSTPSAAGGRARGPLLTAAWTVTFTALLGLGAVGYTQRDKLMRHWPASIRVYAMMGLAPDGMKGGLPAVSPDKAAR